MGEAALRFPHDGRTSATAERARSAAQPSKSMRRLPGLRLRLRHVRLGHHDEVQHYQKRAAQHHVLAAEARGRGGERSVGARQSLRSEAGGVGAADQRRYDGAGRGRRRSDRRGEESNGGRRRGGVQPLGIRPARPLSRRSAEGGASEGQP